MAATQWTNEISVFTSELDAEHRELMRAADELRHAMCNPGLAHAPEKARALIDAMEDHFSNEERLMKSVRYSALAWHKNQHDTLRKRAIELPERAAAGDRKAILKFIRYLKEWMHAHIGVADRMLAAHLRNRERSHHRAS